MSDNATPVVEILDHKDPLEEYDYTFNFARMMAVGEAISSYTVTATDGVTVPSDTNGAQTVTAVFAGGNLGTTSELECAIVTDAGNKFRTTRYLPIRNR